MSINSIFKGIGQEQIVFLITVLLFAAFALSLNGFMATGNMLSLLRSVSVLGVLGLGMLIVVLGRGIDLSMVAIMAISVAWTMQLAANDTPLWLALAYGFSFAILMSLISGVLIAYGEIPPLFATLAMGTFVYGFGRAHLIIGTDVVYMPPNMGWVQNIGQGTLLAYPDAGSSSRLATGVHRLGVSHGSPSPAGSSIRSATMPRLPALAACRCGRFWWRNM
jgi:ribose transport system permease protein